MITIVARPAQHSKADAEVLFESRTWEKIAEQIDQHISKTHDQLSVAAEPMEIYRLQGKIEGLRLLRKLPETVLSTFTK